jgi:hypothetical protein
MCQIFVLLACCTTFDVFRDPCLGARPEVFLVDVLDGFIPSRVAIDGPFVPYIHQFTFQPLIWWNDETLSLDVPSERFVWVVYAFDWVCSFPLFHQGMVMVLDYCYCMFD